MTDTTDYLIAQLKKLRQSLEGEAVPSELQLARVIDLTSSALAGSATFAVIESLNKSKDTKVAIELINTAINSLHSKSRYAITEPERAPQLQAFVSQALAHNGLFKYSIIIILFFNLIAFGLWSFNVKDALGLVEGARAQVDRIKKTIEDTNRNTQNIEDSLSKARLEVRNIEQYIDNQKSKFEETISAEISIVTTASVAALTRIETTRKKADENINNITNTAISTIESKLAGINASIDVLESQYVTMKNKVDEISTLLINLEGTVGNLSTLARAVQEKLDKLPEQLDLLVKDGAGKIDSEVKKEIPAILTTLETKYDGVLSGKINGLADGAIGFINNWRKESRERLSSVDGRLTELENAASALEQRKREDEVKYDSIANFAEQVEGIERRLDTSDGRIRALHDEIAPVDNLINELRDRSGPVAELVTEAMKNVSNEELAQQLWLQIKTNYLIIGLLILFLVSFAWLLVLSYKLKKLSGNGGKPVSLPS